MLISQEVFRYAFVKYSMTVLNIVFMLILFGLYIFKTLKYSCLYLAII